MQLKIDELGRVLRVWGFCPYQTWKRTEASPPNPVSGSLALERLPELVPGVSYRLTQPGAWPVFVNSETSWVCVGEPNCPEPWKSVQFASNSIAVLSSDLLQAIWLHPENLPESSR